MQTVSMFNTLNMTIRMSFIAVVNVPSSSSIVVVSSEKHTVSTTWLIVNAKITFQWL
jgi:hypothetical protein